MHTKCLKSQEYNYVKYKTPPGSLIDIGTGIKPQNNTFLNFQTYICVEPFLPYIEILKQKHPEFIVIHGTWKETSKIFPDKSIDTIIALDVIEHMSKDDGHLLIQEALRIARLQVFIATPYGEYPQAYSPGEKDRWDMDGGYWQSHRSSWTPEDFDSSWDIVQVENVHTLKDGKVIDAFWAFKYL